MSLGLEVGDDQVQAAVAVVVAGVGAHPGADAPVGGHRHPRRQRGLREDGPALVVKEEVRGEIVGHEQVDAAVLVEVGKHRAQPLAVGAIETRRARDVGERAVAVVAEARARPPRIDVGTA